MHVWRKHGPSYSREIKQIMSTIHLINANLHRVKEGARVLEDIARFILRDAFLFNKIRTLRHSLQATYLPFISETDLGGPSLKEKNVRLHLVDVIQANIIRIQEALRVLEEFSEDQLSQEKMKALRYDAYLLQQEITQKAIVFMKQDQLQGLYLIIDTDLMPLSLESMINIINKSSVQLVQLRATLSDKRDFLNQVIRCKELLNSDKLLIINEHVDIAFDLADGVHLGQQDYPIDRIRKRLPDPFIIGASCHTIEEAKFALQSGASYITIECLFSTQGKQDTLVTSLSELAKIRKIIKIPIFAAGEINQTLSAVLHYPVNMVADSAAVWKNPDPLNAIASLQAQINTRRSGEELK